MAEPNALAEQELDVRGLAKPDKHPAIFAAYDQLPVGGSFVLVNNHDPKHLRDEFEADLAGSYDWEYLEKGPKVWRIRISKLVSTPLPRVLVNTLRLDAEETGLVWKLQVADRDLDANVVVLAPGQAIGTHAGPDNDVLIYMLSGTGALTTEPGSEVTLEPGALVWLPRRSVRAICAGPDGLRYLTVHPRRQALVLHAPAPRTGR